MAENRHSGPKKNGKGPARSKSSSPYKKTETSKKRFNSEGIDKKEWKSIDKKENYRPFKKEKPKEKFDSQKSNLKKENFFDEKEERFKKDRATKGKYFSKGSGNKTPKGNPVKKKENEGLTRLNKYLANAGISSRREADTLIQSGVVKVNGVVVDQLGYKIKPTDVVTYSDSVIKNERKVYLLLNKPKDYITTTDDPQARKTVMDLIAKACKERVYPVGRLDRNTTGILLFTNDGDLATKLMHPRHNIPKVYHVSLNKALKVEDYKKITEGFELEDGPVKVDELAYVGEGKKEIGIEIHSGKNRIVRRIFEHFNYEVLKLDRVVYAGLTKKDLPRSKYRFLTEKEISFLKMLR